MNFFAYYKEVGDCTVIEFKTKAERDLWVNYLDDPWITRDTSPFTRTALDDRSIIKAICKSELMAYRDSDNPRMIYHVGDFSRYISVD